MAAKRVDPLKAKEAKQKKIAAVGGVLLLALVGVQGPKTLKMLKGPQPVASATSTTPPPATTPPLGATAPGGTTAAPPPAADLASVADSDVAPEAAEGQLATFERFSSKDPFVQQARAAASPSDDDDAAAGGGAGGQEGAGGAPDDDPSPGDGDGATGAGGFTSGGSGATPPQQPTQPELAQATSIAVNGVAEDVAIEATFPKDEPTFVLVSLAKNGKSVQIGIAGGEYAGGGETMTLEVGKKLTLQNTADGSRYELELLTVQGFPIPKKKS
jgi:hypothetical protein